jgi:hypothetical protein
MTSELEKLADVPGSDQSSSKVPTTKKLRPIADVNEPAVLAIWRMAVTPPGKRPRSEQNLQATSSRRPQECGRHAAALSEAIDAHLSQAAIQYQHCHED